MPDRGIFGQPRGLVTLFFTEMWERFTYYGMRAVLILFMTATEKDGGLGIDDRTASSIYGLYIAATYVFSPFGGWVADRLIGAQRAVIGGAVLIMIGNAMLAPGGRNTFFLGLLIIVLGVGLLKPNVSAIVGHLYPEGGSRRDAGFSIFYMGIAVGSFLGSLLVPICAARFGWHLGFALPAAGMLFGLLQFLLTRRHLAGAGLKYTDRDQRASWYAISLVVAAVAFIATLLMTGKLTINPTAIAASASWLIALLAAGYFIYLLNYAGITAEERRRVYVIAALFIASAIFWAGYEQGGASFNLFAERYTNRNILGWQMPAGVLQATTSLYSILFAPLFALLWLALGRRNKDLSPPAKFAVGLALLGLGFLVMSAAGRHVIAGEKVVPTWLILTYLLDELGAMCLSPVGLSSMTKLAPQRFAGQVMGVWFLSLALGDNLAGQLSGEYDASHLQSLTALFLKLFWGALIGAVVILLLVPVLRRLGSEHG